MNPETPDAIGTEDLIEETVEIVEQISSYGEVILGVLYLVVSAVVIIFILHFLAVRFLYPYTGKSRHVKIVFGTIYAFVLVVAGVLALNSIGFDVSVIGKLALWVVVISGVLLFLLAPFFPRLPFVTGHLVEISGVMGIVDSISTFHTTLRKFDGTVVFVPNALVFASRIMNYSDTPTRRIELKLSVNTDSNLEETRALFLRLMTGDKRVKDKPEPAVFVMDANAAGVEMFAVCWVDNAEWLKTRSDLWIQIVGAFNTDSNVAMSLPQQEVYLIDEGDQATPADL